MNTTPAESAMTPRYLNVGCGRRFFRGDPWINLDVAPSESSIKRWDVREGFPLDSNSCDVVYHSHVLEHLTSEHGSRLLAECHRVLKPGGILRVVVPDLEGICREYLSQLDQARKNPATTGRLDWIKLELLDQCTRQEPGGAMRTFFRDHGLSELDYVVSRIGTIGRELAKLAQPAANPTPPATHNRKKRKGPSLRARLRDAILTPQEAAALRTGQFRTQGEVHLSMYDAVSLGQALLRAGFEPVTFPQTDSSLIPDWDRYSLDRDPDGTEHAPNSLYAEARKSRS